MWLFTVGLFGIGWIMCVAAAECAVLCSRQHPDLPCWHACSVYLPLSLPLPPLPAATLVATRVAASAASASAPTYVYLCSDVFLIPEFVEEHNKKVFHQQMMNTGNSLLFDGEYGVR